MALIDIGIIVGSILLIFLLLPEVRKEFFKKLPKTFTRKYGLVKTVAAMDPYADSPPDPSSPSNFGNPRAAFGMTIPPAGANLTAAGGSATARNRRAQHSGQTQNVTHAIGHSSHLSHSANSTSLTPPPPASGSGEHPSAPEVRAPNTAFVQSSLATNVEDKKASANVNRQSTGRNGNQQESRLHPHPQPQPLHTEDTDGHLDEPEDQHGSLTPSSSFGTSASSSPSSAVISDEFYRTLLCGREFMKFGRHGNPHSRAVRLRLHKNRFVVDWSTGHMDLDSINEIRIGKNTSVFKRKSHANYDEEKCFSIIAPKRTLDLQAKNKTERDLWVAALREITNTQTVQRSGSEDNSNDNDDFGGDEPSVSASASSLNVSLSHFSLPSIDGSVTPPRDLLGDKAASHSGNLQELQTFMAKFPPHQHRLAINALRQKSPHLSFQPPSPLTTNAAVTIGAANFTQHDTNDKRKMRDGPNISSTSATSSLLRQQTLNPNAPNSSPSPTNASGKVSTKISAPAGIQRAGSLTAVAPPAPLTTVKAFANAVHNEQKSDPEARERRKQSIPSSVPSQTASNLHAQPVPVPVPVQPPGGLNFYSVSHATPVRSMSTKNVHSVKE